jgi:hypothetical protein
VRDARSPKAEEGTALVLLPAAVLALVVFASLAFDLSRLFVARRELTDLAASAANDAVALGIDAEQYRAGRGAVLSPAAVDAVVAEALAATGWSGAVRADVRLAGGASPRVDVVLETEVRSLFAAALPEGWEAKTVRGAASAILVMD